MEWVASSLQLDMEQSIQCYYNRSPPNRTPRKPVLDSTDTPADINGLVRFAGRPNLASARVPSHSIFTLPQHVGQVVTTVKPSDNEQPAPTRTNLTSRYNKHPSKQSSTHTFVFPFSPSMCLVGDAEGKPGIPSCE